MIAPAGETADGLRIRASRIAPVTVFGAVFAVASIGPLTSGSPGTTVLGALLAIGSVTLMARHLRHAGAQLDPDGVTMRGLLVTRRIDWNRVTTIRTEHVVDRLSVGDQVRFLDWRGRELGSAWSTVLLVDGSSWQFSAYLEAHCLAIPVDPPEDPRVRDEPWRQPPFEHDPFESIRTVRRAVVGPYVVMVRPRGDRFLAVTIDERTGDEVAVGDESPDLASAIDAAGDQIRSAQERLGNG